MTSFTETNVAYETARDASVYLLSVEPGPFAVIATAHARLARMLKDGNDDLEATVQLLRFARYRLAFNLLPADHDGLELVALNLELSDHVAELQAGTYAHAAAHAAHEALRELITDGETAITRGVIEILSVAPAEERVVALTQTRYVTPTAEYLDSRDLPTRVTGAKRLRGTTLSGTLLCVGSSSQFPPATWNAARTDTTCFVSYPIGPAPTLKGGLFGGDGGLATPVPRASGSTSNMHDLPAFDLHGELTAAADAEHRRRRYERPDATTATLLLLEGGHAVWTSIEEGSWMFSVELETGDRPSIGTLRTEAIAPGAYVIFRDHGASTGLVSAVADSDHGAGVHREQQQRWKAALINAVHSVAGVSAATRQISELGAVTVNLRYWLGEHSIRPRRYEDFEATCKFAGLSDETGRLWAALGKIQHAHRLAGRTIRGKLEVALLADGGEALRRHGHKRVEVGELGTMSAYRVEQVYPERQRIDPELIDRPFPIEGPSWQG